MGKVGPEIFGNLFEDETFHGIFLQKNWKKKRGMVMIQKDGISEDVVRPFRECIRVVVECASEVPVDGDSAQ